MADDDDRSAELTNQNKPAPRRRASRSAGPPVEDRVEATVVTTTETAEAALEQSAPQTDADTATPKAAEPESAVEADSSADAESAADTEPTADTESLDAEPVAKAPRRRPSVPMVVAGVLVLALIAAGIVLLFDRNAASDRDAKRNAYVQTARQTVLNLTTIRPETAKEDVERILAGASGDFKAEFDGRQDPFVSVVKEASVTTEGQIIEAGLEREDGNKAQVLVAARANVTTPDQSQSGPRDFRMRVTVTDDGGTMTASKVEFVP
jgi:Mce-associated membrane protein